MPTLMASLKDGSPGAEARALVMTVAAERLNGVASPVYETYAMIRGRELEPDALGEYHFAKEVPLKAGGLVVHPIIERYAATPDAFVGDDGLVETKCPLSPAKHLATLTGGKGRAGEEYYWQAMAQLDCTGRAWCDVASYHPDFEPHLQLAIERIERDDAAFKKIHERIAWAEAEVAATMARLPAKVAVA